MTEESTSPPLNESLPPKTPIEQIQANTDYSLSILHGLTCEDLNQNEAREKARAMLILFQEDALHELRKAFE